MEKAIKKRVAKKQALSGLGNELKTEAMRYLQNAKDILAEKGKLDVSTGYYADKKYVKAAGHYAYHGVLFALNNCGLIELKKGERLSVEKYQQALGKENRKMLDYFNGCYQQFHLVYGYDGVGKSSTLKEYLNDAIHIIDWCAKRV